jgi:hypothetical protein
VRFRRDQIVSRLGRLIDELKRPVGFYSSMLRVYGTEYGSGAEKALVRELETVCALLAKLEAGEAA